MIFFAEMLVIAFVNFLVNKARGKTTEHMLWPYTRTTIAIFLFSFQQVLCMFVLLLHDSASIADVCFLALDR